HHRSGHEPKVRQGGIAPADIGAAMEDVTKLVAGGHLLKRRSRIGDSDEVLADPSVAHYLPHPLEEILFENVGFQRASRFAGDDEQRALQIQLALKGLD